MSTWASNGWLVSVNKMPPVSGIESRGKLAQETRENVHWREVFDPDKTKASEGGVHSFGLDEISGWFSVLRYPL